MDLTDKGSSGGLKSSHCYKYSVGLRKVGSQGLKRNNARQARRLKSFTYDLSIVQTSWLIDFVDVDNPVLEDVVKLASVVVDVGVVVDKLMVIEVVVGEDEDDVGSGSSVTLQHLCSGILSQRIIRQTGES